MARTVSQYFNVLGGKGEQRLVEDLIIEAIKISGMKVFYVPREYVAADPIFGEDPLSKFTKTFPIEMYFDNPAAGFGGNDRYIITKFGLEMRDTASFIVSRRRFNEAVKHDGYTSVPNNVYTAAEARPTEGDLIYLPLTNDLFIINWSEHESVFYQIGYRYIWRVDVQKYDYSHETIKTGNPQIDAVQDFWENLDSTTNDPLANNDELTNEAEEVFDQSETDVFGDPL